MQILKLFKMKNCSFKSKTGQIKFYVRIEGEKRFFKPFFTNNEKWGM